MLHCLSAWFLNDYRRRPHTGYAVIWHQGRVRPVYCFSHAGSYLYMRDLRALAGARPPEVGVSRRDLAQICSPLTDHLPSWRRALKTQPDAGFADYVLTGIENGFRVGFDHSSPLRAMRLNIPSAMDHSEVVDAYIHTEVAGGRMLGPYRDSLVGDLHVNRMGVIPKGHTPGKWQLITDLSYPAGGSVNDGIDASLCSLQYTTVEAVANRALSLGKGALLAKLDIKSAYRLVSVHPSDGSCWASDGEGHCTSTACCRSAYARHRRFSPPSPTPSSGSYSGGESRRSTIISTILSRWVPRTPPCAGRTSS